MPVVDVSDRWSSQSLFAKGRLMQRVGASGLLNYERLLGHRRHHYCLTQFVCLLSGMLGWLTVQQRALRALRHHDRLMTLASLPELLAI